MTAALALTAVTTVGTLSFLRIFAGAGSVVAPLLAGVVTHALAYAGHRKGRHPALSAAVTAGAAALVAAWVVTPETTVYGIPTGETASELQRLWSEGLDGIRSESAPVPDGHGLVLVATAGIWLAALAAHSVAFQARGMLSAVIPVATLFTLTSALGTERYRVPLTVALVVTILSFVLAQAPAQAVGAHAWFTGGGTRRGAVWRVGIPMIVVAALMAPLVGPRLPEARSTGLVDWKGGGGDRTRVTVSPLVDIRDRLVQDPPVEAFTVRAERPAYWRLAALESYDGVIWSSLADFRSADDSIPSDGNRGTTAPLVQDFRITGLQQFWLPAAYRPVSISLDDARVNHGSLTLLTEQETASGLSYRVESATPAYTPEELQLATGVVAQHVLPQLDVPPTVSPAVARLAAEVTADASGFGPYESARRLQDFFRREFTYSEATPAGHSGDALVNFLFESRTGYCEQFAAAFAVMARTLGIPSRVAVGFIPGTPQGDGSFTVTSADAHAWPEVWIEPFGWVAFEPTPGRGNPAPGDHTGTASEGAVPPPPPEASVTTVAPADAPPAEEPDTPTTVTPGEGGGESEGGGSPWAGRFVAAAAGVLLALVLGVAARLAQRRRSRHGGPDRGAPHEAVLGAWEYVVDELRLDGLALGDSLTPGEIATTAGRHDPATAAAMAELRSLVDVAAYSPAEPARDDARHAWRNARAVTALLERDDGLPERVRRALGVSPRRHRPAN